MIKYRNLHPIRLGLVGGTRLTSPNLVTVDSKFVGEVAFLTFLHI